MRGYIAVSFAEREILRPALEAIKAVLEQHGITSFVFCEQYLFTAEEEQAMMRQAFSDIDQCGLLLAETSYKAIGIGVEVGYAKAKGIPVIYLRRHEAPHSTTIAGASNHQVIYTDPVDLQQQLQQAIANCKFDN